MTTTAHTSPSSSDTSWYIYIVECSDTTYYTGVTTDLERRIHEHNHSIKGAKYTRCRRPVALVYSEVTDSRQSACKREYAIKQMKAAKKKALINIPSNRSLSGHPGPDSL